MANVTFSSPKMAKDITVYAVAGDRGTILSIAKEQKIPIPFDCQDGECGSCIVKVSHLHPSVKYGIALTEKEKEMLRQLGKITKAQIQDAEVNDMPPPYRLACQCFVRDENIVVEFEGDETLPDAAPYVSKAARIYKGGIKINELDKFLAYAVKVEEDAALHFDKLSKDMADCGNKEVAALFAQLAGFSRLHLAEAQQRAGALDVAEHVPPDYVWPDAVTPERTSLLAGDPDLTRLDGLKAALQGEKRGYEFYVAVAATTDSREVANMANQFVSEEAEHVKVLESWINREEWLSKNPLKTDA